MRSLVPVLAVILVTGGCALGPLDKSDREWTGNVTVRGVELIPEGTTLVIRPGTRVRFDFVDEDGDGLGDGGLHVRGKLLALGTREAPVHFEAEGSSGLPGRWGELRLESGGAASIRHCRFSGAQWAVHAHFTPLRVEASVFRDNNGGMKFRGGPVEIYGNTFTGNGTAIRYWESSPEIISNTIRENGTGVFTRLGSERTLLRNNNFIGNLDYHIKLGELQKDDVDARFNYWGGLSPEHLEEKIYDRRDAAYLGKVVHEPAEDAPFLLEGSRRGEGKYPGGAK